MCRQTGETSESFLQIRYSECLTFQVCPIAARLVLAVLLTAAAAVADDRAKLKDIETDSPESALPTSSLCSMPPQARLVKNIRKFQQAPSFGKQPAWLHERKPFFPSRSLVLPSDPDQLDAVQALQAPLSPAYRVPSGANAAEERSHKPALPSRARRPLQDDREAARRCRRVRLRRYAGACRLRDAHAFHLLPPLPRA
jgi:hypothetical protein